MEMKIIKILNLFEIYIYKFIFVLFNDFSLFFYIPEKVKNSSSVNEEVFEVLDEIEDLQNRVSIALLFLSLSICHSLSLPLSFSPSSLRSLRSPQFPEES